MRSIRNRLLIGLLLATFICTAGAALLLFLAVLEETNELADLQLRQLASALPEVLDSAMPVHAPGDPEEDFVLQAWAKHELVYTSPGRASLPNFQASGLADVKFGGTRWRIYGEQQHGRYVQVAQPQRERDRLAAHMVLKASYPLLLFVAVLGMLIALTVRIALAPLNRLAKALADKSPTALHPLPGNTLPPELQPIVAALNHLLGQCDEALTSQRTFVADAAHELRSPLAAFKLQLELAERASDSASKSEALSRLRLRLDRTTHLVHQLLTLARHETPPGSQELSLVNVDALLRTAVIDHTPIAESLGIDLGLTESCAVTIRASAPALQILVNNLIDNAVRYTPAGGRVDVAADIFDGQARLHVQDTGPGVPAAQRERLFDRFFRLEGHGVSGCGLGLSIVRSIADHHGAHITLGDSPSGSGLHVMVTFPTGASYPPVSP